MRTEKRPFVGMGPAGVERKNKHTPPGEGRETRGTETTCKVEELTLEISVESFL